MILKNLGKNVIFENCIKIGRLKKIKCLMIFKVARPVCSRLHFDLRKHFTQKSFIFKTFFFLHFLPKNEAVKEFFPKHHQTVVHINAQIWAKISSISSAHCQINEIENVRL